MNVRFIYAFFLALLPTLAFANYAEGHLITRIQFQDNSTELVPNSVKVRRVVSNWAENQQYVVLVGYSVGMKSRGSRELARERVRNVYDAIIVQGVPAHRIRTYIEYGRTDHQRAMYVEAFHAER